MGRGGGGDQRWSVGGRATPGNRNFNGHTFSISKTWLPYVQFVNSVILSSGLGRENGQKENFSDDHVPPGIRINLHARLV